MEPENVQSTAESLGISTMQLQEHSLPYQINSRLMQLPENVIFLFQAFLEPASKIAFSLACRGLYEMYFSRARKARASASDSQKRQTIFLLEKDVGDREFFCPFCRCFRAFGPGWREGLCLFERYHNIDPEDPSSRRLAIRDNGGPELTFPLGRLVMNRHFFGEDRGLPLSCLEVTDLPVKAAGEGENALTWRQTIRARIIGDELYIRCTHVLDQAEQEGMDLETLRLRLWGRSRYKFCRHQSTGSLFSFENPVFVGQSWCHAGDLDRDQFTAHNEMGFGCPQCVTDCTTSVEWRPRLEVGADGTDCEDPGGWGSWVIRVDTYRQLGSFRRADDPRYMLACTTSPMYYSPRVLGSARRGMSERGFRVGMIWRRWHDHNAPSGGWLSSENENHW